MAKTHVSIAYGSKVVVKKTPVFVRVITTIALMLLVFAISIVIASSPRWLQNKPATDFESCTKQKGSTIKESYPAICLSKEGIRFIQPISPQEQILLSVPLDENQKLLEGRICGGSTNLSCPPDYTCKLEANYPEREGVCVKN